jgi:hypothetical protein
MGPFRTVRRKYCRSVDGWCISLAYIVVVANWRRRRVKNILTALLKRLESAWFAHDTNRDITSDVAVTIIGSGLGTAIVAAFLKKRFDSQLETHKALLQRSGKVHERQVDALLKIHSKLEEALFYLQRVAGAAKFAGEVSDKELLARMSQPLAAASEEFSKNRLLVSESLEQKLDEFFNKMLSGGMTMNLALDPMVPNGDPRAKLWDEARQTAYKDLPSILKAIRAEARAVIHG